MHTDTGHTSAVSTSAEQTFTTTSTDADITTTASTAPATTTYRTYVTTTTEMTFRTTTTTEPFFFTTTTTDFPWFTLTSTTQTSAVTTSTDDFTQPTETTTTTEAYYITMPVSVTVCDMDTGMPVKDVECEIFMYDQEHLSFLTESPLITDQRGRTNAEFTISSAYDDYEIAAEIVSVPEGYSMMPVSSVIYNNTVSDNKSPEFTIFIQKTEES